MKLREDWRKILRYAWSIRFNLLATFFGILEIALPIVDEIVYIPRGIFLVLAILSNLLANLSRIIAQKEFKDGE